MAKSKTKSVDAADEAAKKIAGLLNELNEIRIQREGWYQVAENRQATIDKQALMLDQNASQIEGLRRRLDEANAFIDTMTGVKPSKRGATQQPTQHLA
jgi:uncharacterized coiled-coil DUF342 family protein